MRRFPRTSHIARWLIAKESIIEAVVNGPKDVNGLPIVDYATLPLAR